MKKPYLEVTFRRGRAVAGYLYLGRRVGEKSYRSVRMKPGLVIDFNRDGAPIGIETTMPGKITLASLNTALRSLGVPAIRKADLASLATA